MNDTKRSDPRAWIKVARSGGVALAWRGADGALLQHERWGRAWYDFIRVEAYRPHSMIAPAFIAGHAIGSYA